MLKFYINAQGYMAVELTSTLVGVDLLEMQMDMLTDSIIELGF